MAKVKMTRGQHEILSHLDKAENEAQAQNRKALLAIDAELAPKLKEVTRKHTTRAGEVGKTRQAIIKDLQEKQKAEEREFQRRYEKLLAAAHADTRPQLGQIELDMWAELDALNKEAEGKKAELYAKLEVVLADCRAKREAVKLVAEQNAPLEPEKPTEPAKPIEQPVAQPSAQPATQSTPA